MSAEEPRDLARLRDAFASLSNEEERDTVDAARIFDALHGNATSEERQAVIEELLVNPAAAEAWRLAREMAPDAPRETSAGTTSKTVASHTVKWMSIAAAALLVVAVGWQFSPWRRAEEAVYRSVETRAIASALPRGAALARGEPVLRWTGVDRARYRVRILTPELDVLEESAELQQPEYRISEETLRRIAPGSQILWQVEGRVPGETVIVSPTFSSQVP